MSTIFKILKSEVTAIPVSLSYGALAYSSVSKTLYIGDVNNHPVAIAGLSLIQNSNAQVAIAVDGASVGVEQKINFIGGTNVSVSASNNSGNSRVDVTINVSIPSALTASSVDNAGAITLGGTNATSVAIGKSGVTTTVNGNLATNVTANRIVTTGTGGVLSALSPTNNTLVGFNSSGIITQYNAAAIATLLGNTTLSTSVLSGITSIDGAGAITLGGTNATSVAIGKSGANTTVNGNLTTNVTANSVVVTNGNKTLTPLTPTNNALIGFNNTGVITQYNAAAIATLLGNTPLNSNAKVAISVGGTLIGTEQKINFIGGTNVTLSATNDSANNVVNLTIAASSSGGGGSSNVTWQSITTNTTASVGNGYCINASLTLTLPASPALNDTVYLKIPPNSSTITLTVDGNGHNIETVNSPFIINSDRFTQSDHLEYINSYVGWQFASQEVPISSTSPLTTTGTFILPSLTAGGQGLFYQLGTNYGTQAWITPYGNSVTALTNDPSSDLASLFSNTNINYAGANSVANPWIVIDIGYNNPNRKIRLTEIIAYADPSYNGYYSPNNFKWQISLDSPTWDVAGINAMRWNDIFSTTTENLTGTTPGGSNILTFDLTTCPAFTRYIRLYQNGVRSGDGHWQIILGQIDFSGEVYE